MPSDLKILSKEIETMTCPCGKCQFYMSDYTKPRTGDNTRKHSSRKAGAIIYDPHKEMILLVQSRGNLWGCPKGSIEDTETFQTGAAREVQEETGVVLRPEQLIQPVWINSAVAYFYVELPSSTSVGVQTRVGNDANGVVWLKSSCMSELVTQGFMRITSHTRRALSIKLDIDLQRKGA